MKMTDTNVKHGSVKWFNRKKGFGFITPQNDDGDVFVHHTGIVVNGEVSRYLIDNEYVEYTVEPVEQGSDRVRANFNQPVPKAMLKIKREM